MKLTDNEIRDIRKYLEAGKPLPEQYRFLLFEEKREVELVWNGKTNEVCNVVLPFQTIEHIDEPRVETGTHKKAAQLDIFDARGRQLGGWTNKLIWGDNKLILSSLKNGPLRKEIEDQGGLKLIYIDPPFDVGADFSINIEIGDEQFTKEPSVLEDLAYRDTWGKGTDSFIAMIYERLNLMHDLLADDGSIYVHVGWQVGSLLRLVLDEVFGSSYLRNEIIWQRFNFHADANRFGTVHETIWFYVKNESVAFKKQYLPVKQSLIDSHYKQDADGRYYTLDNPTAPAHGRPAKAMSFGGKTISPPAGAMWRWKQENIDQLWNAGKIVFNDSGMPRVKRYLDEIEGTAVHSIWTDIRAINSQADERIDYPTQKPEALLERIIQASSNEGDLIADFFCGSGTTLAVAEKLGRKWIGSDLGKFAIHTSRKRMIGVQRGLKEEGKNYRAFEILNLGKYERQLYVGVNENLREEEKREQLAQKEREYAELILNAYRAEAAFGFKTFSGKRSARLVAIGPINHPVTRDFIDDIIKECLEKQITKADVLAFEFEMGLSPQAQEEAKDKGIDLALKHIPKEVFDKRAVEKNQVVFHDVSFVEVKPHIKKKSAAVELTDFGVFYTQDSIDNVAEALKDGASKIALEGGKIVKVSKDKKGIVKREVLTKKWTDWIDYWAVDFDFESKKEIVRVPKTAKAVQVGLDGSAPAQQLSMDQYEEKWTGDYIFENEWQSFRTKKDRTLELKSAFHEYPAKGRYKIGVKVVDIFGNDTMKVIEVGVG